MGILASKIVKTRSKRTCWGCGMQFERGVCLRSQLDSNSGDRGGSYWCKVCDKTIEGEDKKLFEDGIEFASVSSYESWQENLNKYSRTYSIEELQKSPMQSKQEETSTKEVVELATYSTDYKQQAVTEENVELDASSTDYKQAVAELAAFSTDYERAVAELVTFSKNYKRKVDEMVARSSENDEEVQSTPEEFIEAVTLSTEREQETEATEEVIKSVACNMERLQEVVSTEKVIEAVKSSSEREQEEEAAISLHNHGEHLEDFFKFIRAFNADSLLNDLREMKPDYENDDKFFEIAGDLEDLEELAKQLFVNIENYIFEPVLREDEDNRSLYLIYLTNEKKNSFENRLIGVADNIERLQYTVRELLDQYIIGKNNETYNLRRFHDVNYLNTIPYLFVDKTTLNQVETDRITLREAK